LGLKEWYDKKKKLRLPNEVDEIYSEKEILERISKITSWFHVIQLGTKISTPGSYKDVLRRKIFDAIPNDLTNKTVLDVGANQGLFAFECEKRNAKEIVAVDLYDDRPQLYDGIKLCKEILNSKVQIVKFDIMEIEKLKKEFDIILFFGVVYALRNPFLALQKLYSICKELVIVEGMVLRNDKSICYVLEKDEILKGQSLTIAFSPRALMTYAQHIGFTKTEFLGFSTEERVPMKSDKNTEGEQLTRNRGIFYLWK